MAICWLRFLLGLPDEELWSLLQRVGTQGISTDELEWLLRKYDLLDGTALFFFEPAGTSIGTDGSMHHLADGGHAQHGARELTAREVVAEMRLSDKDSVVHQNYVGKGLANDVRKRLASARVL
jgi:hypothetical protein